MTDNTEAMCEWRHTMRETPEREIWLSCIQTANISRIYSKKNTWCWHKTQTPAIFFFHKQWCPCDHATIKQQETTNKFLFGSSGVVLTASLCSIEACEEKRFQCYCVLGLFTHSFKFDLQKWHAQEARVMFQWVHIVRATQVVHMTAILTLGKDRRRP